MHNNIYKDMLVILYHLIDNKMWLIKGDVIPSVNSLTIGKKKSIYDENISDKTNIINKINEQLQSCILFNEKDILGQINHTGKIEHEHRIKREEKLKNNFDIKYPETECMVYDALVNNFKCQDKAGKKNINKNYTSFKFEIKKSANKQWYKTGDNDFYWLYNTTNSKFLVIPELIMIDNNFVDCDNNQKLSSTFSINFENCEGHKFEDYIFDYDKLDVDKLKNLLSNT